MHPAAGGLGEPAETFDFADGAGLAAGIHAKRQGATERETEVKREKERENSVRAPRRAAVIPGAL